MVYYFSSQVIARIHLLQIRFVKRLIIIGICVVGGYAFAKAQSSPPELGRFEYTILPDMGDVQMERYQLNGMIGKKTKNGFLGFGISYAHIDFVFKGLSTPFDFNSYREMQVIQPRVMYRHLLKNNWSLQASVQPTLSSNFSGSLSSEDLQFNIMLNASKSWGEAGRQSQLSFGVLYGVVLGEPGFLPLVQYTKQVNEHLSYAIGIPRTGVFYTFDKNTLGLQLAPNGLYSNNSEYVSIPELGSIRDTKLQLNGIGVVLEHNYRLDDLFSTSIKAGYVVGEELSIRDVDGNKIYTFDTSPTPTISMGIKMNINKRRNTKNKHENE